MRSVILLQPAEQEVLNAAMYYDEQVSGLGDKFLDKVNAALLDIEENPFRWPVIHQQVRRRLIHRFPFGLYYRIDQDEVVVLAVAHLHRRPNYWADRI